MYKKRKPVSVTENCQKTGWAHYIQGILEKSSPNFPRSVEKAALLGRQLHPIFSVITSPAWETIAVPILPRSLPLVAYLNLGYIRRLKDSV